MAIVKVRKPPRRGAQTTSRGLPPGQQRMTYGPAPKVSAGRPGQQASFVPAAYKPPVFNVNKNLAGLPRSNPGAYYPTKPGQMPVQFDPNADTGTLQGAVNAGLLPWNKGLGNLGIKPPPRAPTDINIPGYHPGTGSVTGDWEYQAALGDINAANAADAAAAGENINALAVGWGGDLSNLVKAGLIDQKAADAAKANQFSTMNELQRSLTQGQGRAQAQLAARGILSSGALPGANAELDRQFQQESTTGLQQLMSNIRGIRASQAQAAAERQGGLASVRGNVAARLAADAANQAIPDMQAFWDPSVGAYVDDWGRRFDASGKRLS